jgi:hypothetical protein
MNKAPQPPLEYLASASHTSLEGLELARLNHIACLRAEIQQALEELVAAEVDARLAHRLSTHHSLHNVLLLCPSDPTPASAPASVPPPPPRTFLHLGPTSRNPPPPPTLNPALALPIAA